MSIGFGKLKNYDFLGPLGQLSNIFEMSNLLGPLGQLSNMLKKPEGSSSHLQEAVTGDEGSSGKCISGFYEEYPILKSEYVQNFVTVTVRKNSETDKNLVEFDTDIPGEVIIHWGVCKGNTMTWEIPPEPHPPATKVFRQKALQTLLEVRRWRCVLVEANI